MRCTASHGFLKNDERAECVQVAGLSKCVKVTLNGSKVYSEWRGSSKNADISIASSSILKHAHGTRYLFKIYFVFTLHRFVSLIWHTNGLLIV